MPLDVSHNSLGAFLLTNFIIMIYAKIEEWQTSDPFNGIDEEGRCEMRTHYKIQFWGDTDEIMSLSKDINECEISSHADGKFVFYELEWDYVYTQKEWDQWDEEQTMNDSLKFLSMLGFIPTAGKEDIFYKQ